MEMWEPTGESGQPTASVCRVEPDIAVESWRPEVVKERKAECGQEQGQTEACRENLETTRTDYWNCICLSRTLTLTLWWPAGIASPFSTAAHMCLWPREAKVGDLIRAGGAVCRDELPQQWDAVVPGALHYHSESLKMWPLLHFHFSNLMQNISCI